MMLRRVLAVEIFLALTTVAGFAELIPDRLRCEYLTNPLGIDAARPRLSWILSSTVQGDRQTAYRVTAASTEQLLAGDKPDLWDSGKVSSNETVHVEYAGKQLSSRMRCYWKVRVWDRAGRASRWSDPAMWSMGLLERSEWGAQWISDPKTLVAADADRLADQAAHFGYRSQYSTSPDSEKWVAVDLGAERLIDSVRLYSVRDPWQSGAPARFFPVRFKIEAAATPDFAKAQTVVDRTSADEPAPSSNGAEYPFASVTARYVRIRATHLRRENETVYGLALAEFQVLSQGTNVARGAVVTALDSAETRGWSKANLVDGRTAAIRSEPVAQPAALLRKQFRLTAAVRHATVFATARGLYELRVNGRRVGDRLLTPEWTSYQKRLQYQTYDVTEHLRSGENVIGALLGAGWYTGRIGLFPGRRHIYGTIPQLLVRLEVELADGRREIVVSDASWRRAPETPILAADFLDGESFDARKETVGWDAPEFSDREWPAVSADASPGEQQLVSQPNEPLRVVREVKPAAITEPAHGVWVFDLGQNVVGWCRMKVKGRPGEPVTIRHAEMLNDDGSIYTANLRGATPVDQYIPRSSAEETFEPHFTYHGFRYVEVRGLVDRPSADALVARVIHSAAPDTGTFETSSPYVNHLMRNIVWTQRANLFSVPTDCPQRDERLGWMGDIQAFAQTAIFNMDVAAYLTKWLQDVRDDQTSDGRFPDFAPNPHAALKQDQFFGAPAWGDAGTVVPWRLYQNYGDIRILERHFDAARRWVDFIERNNPNLLWEKARGNDYNDWLNADTLILEGWPKSGGAVPKPVFATAFFAHSTEIVAKMAAVLGRNADAERYRSLFERVKSAFNRAFVAEDGHIQGDTQAGYALALNFNLLPDEVRMRAFARMLDGFSRYGGHLSTGIQSTHRLMLELSRGGCSDEAYRLLNLRTFPSWGFMIENGATTIWERWDGYVKGRGFQNPEMNSFNHWALGSVGEWMWRVIAGINPDENAPGFRHFEIRPQPGGGLTWARGEYQSIRGRIVSDWKIENRVLRLRVAVPPNTSATVYMPGIPGRRVESGEYEFTEPYE